jgi:hypothetical protein
MALGFRSGLESAVHAQLTGAGLDVAYEAERIEYTKPARKSKYTPDFRLPSGVYIETKGRFTTEDRQKHLLIKEQHPHLDIRFVFSNSRARISKQSATTYADWCTKHGFKFHDKVVPTAWIKETK